MRYKRQRIEWYKSERLAIFFSQMPNIIMRETNEDSNKFEVMDVENYPFRNVEPFVCTIFDHKEFKKHQFVIPKMNYDGATIPKFLWLIIGANTDPLYKRPALLHDYVCIHKEVIKNNRELSTEVFKAMLYREGVPKLRANIMCFFVDLFQRLFCHW